MVFFTTPGSAKKNAHLQQTRCAQKWKNCVWKCRANLPRYLGKAGGSCKAGISADVCDLSVLYLGNEALSCRPFPLHFYGIIEGGEHASF